MNMYRPKVYTASKASYVRLWRLLREDPDWDFVDWTASWVDHPDIDAEAEGVIATPETLRDAWIADVNEVKASDFVLLYGKDNDAVRGSLIEAGIALGLGLGVVVAGLSPAIHTWIFHPAVKFFPSLGEARQHLYKFTTMAPPTRRKK